MTNDKPTPGDVPERGGSATGPVVLPARLPQRKVERLIAALTSGGPAADYPRPAPHQTWVGTSGIWLGGDAYDDRGRARVFTKQVTTSPKWREEWVILDLDAYEDVSPQLEYLYLGESTNYMDLVDELETGTTYYRATMLFDYLYLPSSSEVAALPGNIPGTAYTIHELGGSTMHGRMFREDLSTTSTIKYRDHWALWNTYLPPNNNGDFKRKQIDSNFVDLKSFMQQALQDASGKWYLQITYTIAEKKA